MRKRLFEIIEVASDDTDKASDYYDVFMMLVIIISIIPLAFVTECPIFDVIDKVTVVVLIIDHVFRLITADFKLSKGTKSYIYYNIGSCFC